MFRMRGGSAHAGRRVRRNMLCHKATGSPIDAVVPRLAFSRRLSAHRSVARHAACRLRRPPDAVYAGA
jgi:hypothetical protein